MPGSGCDHWRRYRRYWPDCVRGARREFSGRSVVSGCGWFGNGFVRPILAVWAFD